MLALLAGTTVLLSIVSERIFACDGLGYDGAGYGLIAMRFMDFVRGESLMVSPAIYYRFLPSALCHFALRGVGAELTSTNVILFFQIYQAAVLMGICIIWCALSERMCLGRRGKWWGFLGLFGNYAVLKYGFYYPVLLDLSGVLLGIALLYAYLAERTALLLVITCLSFFIWPLATCMGGILTIFPHTKTKRKPTVPNRFHGFIAFVAVVIVLFPKLLTIESSWQATKFPSVLPFSIAFVGGYLFYVFWGLFPGMVSALQAAMCNRGFIFRVLLLFLAVSGILLLPQMSPAFVTADWALIATKYFSGAIALGYYRPGEFVVSLLLYFGPFFSFTLFFYPQFMRQCRDLGLGFTFVMLLLALQSLSPLTRQMMAGLPFLSLPLALAIDNVKFSGNFIKLFVVTSLIASKVWMLNNLGIDKSAPGEHNSLFWSRYTSSTGWWMTDDMYLVQGALVLGILTLLAVYLKINGTIKIPEIRTTNDA